MGIGVDAKTLKRLHALALRHFKGIIDGDLEAFAETCISTLYIILAEVNRAMMSGEIAPRDIPNAGKSVAMMHSLITGENTIAQYSQINLMVVGADGEAFDPSDVPQVSDR